MEISGFDDLFGTLEALGKVGDSVGKKAVRAGLKEVLKQMQIDAPKDTGNSAKELNITKIKQYKGGTVWGSCGISSSNWEETKALWYQHYGYENKAIGKRTETNVGWMIESFEKSNQKAENEIYNNVINEINKILK